VTVWCLTTSLGNVARTAELGWTVQGIKRRRRPTAARVAPGDKLVYYVSGAIAFAAVAEITGTFYEDHTPVWTSGPGEDYPWRFPIRPEIVLAEADWVPAADVQRRLSFPRRWPADSWHLAFQGNIREWPREDYTAVRDALRAAERPVLAR
jgi:hypothetical protein